MDNDPLLTTSVKTEKVREFLRYYFPSESSIIIVKEKKLHRAFIYSSNLKF